MSALDLELFRILKGSGRLTLDDLLAPDRYERDRADLRRACITMKRARRLQLGPHFSLLFENRATVWLQIQEELRWASSRPSGLKGALLERYNPLVPGRGELTATLLMECTDSQIAGMLSNTLGPHLRRLRVSLGNRVLSAVPLEPETAELDAVTYLRFVSTSQTPAAPASIRWLTNGHAVAAVIPHEVEVALRYELGQSARLDGTAPGAAACRQPSHEGAP